MMWTEAEQEVSVDIVTLRGALLCLSPVNLPCLMHTLIKTLLLFFSTEDHKDFRDLQAAFCVVKLGDLTKNTTHDFLHDLHTVCVFR